MSYWKQDFLMFVGHWFNTFSISGSKWLGEIIQNHEGHTFIQNWVEKMKSDYLTDALD